MSVDICIVSYRTPIYLERMLESLMEYAPVDSKIFIRVNCMDDDDARVLADYKDVVHHIEFGDNIGYARSVNRLASLGVNPVIAVFNADVKFDSNAIQYCVDELMEHDDWGVLGPRSVDSRGKLTHAGIFGSNSSPKHRSWKSSDSNSVQDVKEAVTVSGSAYFVKRSVWDELTICPSFREACHDLYQDVEGESPLGAFLPTDHYYEETFCSYHARSHGYKVIYLGSAKVIHEWHKSSSIGSDISDGKMKKSRLEFRVACDIHGIERD